MAFKLALAVGVVISGAVVFGYLAGGKTAIPVSVERYRVDDLAPGHARRVEWNGRPVIVLRRADPAADWFVAIASGTAMGCPVSWEPAQRTFLESCSGTRYDADGRPIDTHGLAPLKIPPHHFDTAGRLVLGSD